ncbi:MAG: hypothetical protein ACRC7N_04495, partial [Clostridium sp.]
AVDSVNNYISNENIEVRYSKSGNFQSDNKTIFGKDRENNIINQKKDSNGNILQFIDSDKDGIPDNQEVALGGNINLKDTDLDGLSDSEEVLLGLKLNNNDTNGNKVIDSKEDNDKDTLSNEVELNIGISPINKDTDSDGIEDNIERNTIKTNPNLMDTDLDGLTDKEEVDLKTNPLVSDNNKDILYEKTVDNNDIADLKLSVKGKIVDLKTVYLNKVSNSELNKLPGLISDIYDIKYEGQLEDLALRFNKNNTQIKAVDKKNIALIYVGQGKEEFESIESNLTETDSELIFKLKDIKKIRTGQYLLVDYQKWAEQWNKMEYKVEGQVKNTNAKKVARDFLLLSDNSIFFKAKIETQDNNFINPSREFITELFKSDRIATSKSVRKSNNGVIDHTYIGDTPLDFYRGTSLVNIGEYNEFDSGTLVFHELIRKASEVLQDTNSERDKYLILSTCSTYEWIENPDDKLTGLDYSKFKDYLKNRNESIEQNKNKISLIIFDYNDIFSISNHERFDNQELERKGLATIYYIKKPENAGGKSIKQQISEAYDKVLETTGGSNNYDLINNGKDTDNDGLSDELENQGLRDAYGRFAKTDYLKSDTDGDGITDGAEVGVAVHTPQILYDKDYAHLATGINHKENINNNALELINGIKGGHYLNMISDPSLADTDGDGTGDLYELEYGLSDIWMKDTDGDKLSDTKEFEIKTLPTEKDTDGDTLSDFEEIQSLLKHPLIFNEVKGQLEYIAEYVSGYLVGDFIGDPSITNMLGTISSNLTPGLGVVADIRDVIGSLFNREWSSATSNAIGLVPIGGDTVQVIGKINKWLSNASTGSKIQKYGPYIMQVFNKSLSVAQKVDMLYTMYEGTEALSALLQFFEYTVAQSERENVPFSERKVDEKQAKEILKKLFDTLDEDSVKVTKFIEAIEKSIKESGTKFNNQYKGFGKYLEAALIDSNGAANEERMKEIIMNIGYDIEYSTPGGMKNLSQWERTNYASRIKGWLGESVFSRKYLNNEKLKFKSIKNSKLVRDPGPDDILISLPDSNGNYVVKIVEAKCYSTQLTLNNMSKYFERPKNNYNHYNTDAEKIKHIEETYLNGDYLLGFIDGANKDKVLQDLKSGKAKLEVVVENLRPDRSGLDTGKSREINDMINGINGKKVKTKGALIQGKIDKTDAIIIDFTFSYNASHLNDNLK